MTARLVVVDTSVLVAGLLTSVPDAPTARIVDAMLDGSLGYLLSVALLAEYRTVLLRPRIAERHGLDDSEIDALLTRIASLGVVRSPRPSATAAPDPGDNHLWALLATEEGTVLVTGDRALLNDPPANASVVTPRDLVAWFGLG